MAKTALIIEDDEASAKVLAALCAKLGVESETCRNGKDGVERARALSPDLVLLDLLLPGIDGLKVAEMLKAAGLRSQMVAMSGVYKDPKIAKDFADKYGADFFQKPFKNEEVSDAIARRLGLAQEAKAPAPRRSSVETPVVNLPPMEGTLREKPFTVLVMELFRARASGTLDLTFGQMRKRIYLNRGQIRFAQSNMKAENVGGMQVAEGAITEEQFRTAVARAKAEGTGIGEALAVAGVMTYDALTRAQRRQTEEVCITAVQWREASFKFIPGSTDQIQDSRQDPVAVLLAAYKRFVTPEHARAELSAFAKGTAARGPDFDRCLFTVRAVFPGETLTPMVNGRQTVGEAAGRARAEDLVLLWALIDLGVATVSGLEAKPKPEARASTAAPARPYTVEEEAAREMILAEYERAMNAPDLFGVLRLPRGASIEEVKGAYLPLAKRFHADSYSGLMLGEATDKAGELFARISEAHATLSDPKRRADYEVLLERKQAGLPTDMEVIFKAEASFNRADALMKQGRFGDAEAAIREALKLDASVAQYHLALGQVLLKSRGAAAAADARAALDKALSMSPELTAAKLQKAAAFELEGDTKAAETLLRDVLAVQPDNAEASRTLRALRERSKKNESKGLLGKLFKR